MSLYGSFKYGAETYGASTPSNLLWGLDIDWDDDGVFSGENEGECLQNVDISRGRNYLLSSGGESFEPVQVGTCTLVLSNHDGRYDPYNASSPLYPNVSPGKLIRLRVRDGATIYNVFAGMIQEIEPSDFATVPTVMITCEDGLRWLQDFGATTGVYQSIFSSYAMELLLSLANWPTQWGYSLSNGMDLLDYWWGKDRSVYAEILALSDSELGRIFCANDGSFRFQSRQSAPASVMTIDQASLLKNIRLSQPWEIQRNVATIKSNPIQAETLGDIWDGSGMAIGASTTIEIWAEFSNAAIDIVSPVATTDYLANRNSDGLGTNLTSYITVTMETFSDRVKLTITNSYTRVAYLTLLKVRGRLLSSNVVSAQETATGYEKHPRSITFDLEWQQDANNPAVFAEQLLALLNTAPALPTIQIEQRPSIQFGLDLFDPVTLTIDRVTINSVFRVGSISHKWMRDTGQAVLTTIKTEPYWTYDYWLFDSNAVLNTSLLGW